MGSLWSDWSPNKTKLCPSSRWGQSHSKQLTGSYYFCLFSHITSMYSIVDGIFSSIWRKGAYNFQIHGNQWTFNPIRNHSIFTFLIFVCLACQRKRRAWKFMGYEGSMQTKLPSSLYQAYIGAMVRKREIERRRDRVNFTINDFMITIIGMIVTFTHKLSWFT